MKRKWTLLLVAALVLALIPVGRAMAVSLTLPLNNDTADLCTVDCPGTGESWHFVITPNNGESVFVTFHLNLGDATTYDTTIFLANGSQLDNVFVAVPTGKTYLSLEATGSSADITWSGDGKTPDKFVLSSVCGTQVPEPSTLLLLGSGLFGLGLMRRRRD